jgi:hypothetical protein
MNAITDQLLGPGDGKSPCTMLNVLRLAVAGKIAVLFNVPDKDVISIKSVNAWRNFIAHCSDELRRDVKERATPDEWRLVETSDQPTLLSAMKKAPSAPAPEEVKLRARPTPRRRPKLRCSTILSKRSTTRSLAPMRPRSRKCSARSRAIAA